MEGGGGARNVGWAISFLFLRGVGKGGYQTWKKGCLVSTASQADNSPVVTD